MSAQAQRLINNLKAKGLPVSKEACHPHLLSQVPSFGDEHINAAPRLISSAGPAEEAFSFGKRMAALPCVPSYLLQGIKKNPHKSVALL